MNIYALIDRHDTMLAKTVRPPKPDQVDNGGSRTDPDAH
jgi:hypothetical protein